MFSVYAIKGDYKSSSNELIRLEEFIRGEKKRLVEMSGFMIG